MYLSILFNNINSVLRLITLKNKHVIYSMLVISSALFSVAKYAVFANMLGVESFGIYSLILTNYVFVIYIASFGANETMLKLGGIAFGQNKVKEIPTIRNKSLLYGLISIISISFFSVLLLSILLQDNILEIILFSIAIAISAFAFNILESYFRAKQQLIIFSGMLFIKSLLLLVAGFMLVNSYGLYGILYCEIFSFLGVFGLFFLFSDKGNLPNLYLFFEDLKNIIINGMHLLSSMFLRLLAFTFDRWAIAYTLGTVAVGKYAFIMIIYQVGIMGLGLITNIMGPRWLASHARDADAICLLSNINRAALFITFIVSIISLPFFYAITFFVEKYYIVYYDTNFFEMIVLTYIGVYFLCVCQLYDWFFIAISRESVLNKISVINLILSISFVFIVSFNPTLLSYFIVFVIVRILIGIMYFLSVLKYRNL